MIVARRLGWLLVGGVQYGFDSSISGLIDSGVLKRVGP